jgi:hypothetical protein
LYLWLDDETNSYELYEKIKDYTSYVEHTVLSDPGFVADPCGRFFDLIQDDCSIQCHGTKRAGRCGNLAFPGTIQHWLIEFDYLCVVNPNTSLAEYMIPNSSLNGKAGYADLVDLSSGEIFEIKPVNLQVQGELEVSRYVAMANTKCAIGRPWKKGENYTQRVLVNPLNPFNSVVANLAEPGVITYEDGSIDLLPQVVPFPYDVNERIKRFWQRIKNLPLSQVDLEVAKFLNENSDIRKEIIIAVNTFGIAIIIGTLIEDIYTLGFGVMDDPASFYVAWRLIRIGTI